MRSPFRKICVWRDSWESGWHCVTSAARDVPSGKRRCTRSAAKGCGTTVTLNSETEDVMFCVFIVKNGVVPVKTEHALGPARAGVAFNGAVDAEFGVQHVQITENETDMHGFSAHAQDDHVAL